MSESDRVLRTRHWQRLCGELCTYCRAEADREDKNRKAWFKETGMTVMIDGKIRPVLISNESQRLFAGETLGMLNPAGLEGRVWSAKDIDTLQYNINFRVINDDDGRSA